MAKTVTRHCHTHSLDAQEIVKEEELDVSESLTRSATRFSKRPREPSVSLDDAQCTLDDLKAHPLFDEAEFNAKYFAACFTNDFQEESQLSPSSFNSQWCAKQDAKIVVRRKEAIVKYLREKMALLASSNSTSPILIAKAEMTTNTPSSPPLPLTPTPVVKTSAVKIRATPMWTPNLSRDILSAPSLAGCVLSDGRPAPQLRWTPSSRWLPFSSPAVGAAAVDDESDNEPEPALDRDEVEEELELAGRILLRAEENLIEARLRYTRAYVCCKKLKEL